MHDSKYEVKREVNIYWAQMENAFLRANKDLQIEAGTRTIGSSTSAIKQMITKSDEQRAIMPTVIGVDANSQSVNWNEALKNYWDSLSVVIPEGGKPLNIGYVYNFETDNPELRKNIDKLIKTQKDIKDSKTLAEYVESNVEEEFKYLYGRPSSAEDYMLWRYCLVYGFVANSFKDISKAPKKIKFYLFSEAEREQERISKHKLKRKVMERYIDIVKNEDVVDGVLIMMGKGNKLASMDSVAKEAELELFSNNKPQEFLALTEDKNLSTKAKIEQLIDSNILRRLPNTQIIVETNDVDNKIGNSMDEAVLYFKEQKNKAKISEFEQIYKDIKKK